MVGSSYVSRVDFQLGQKWVGPQFHIKDGVATGRKMVRAPSCLSRVELQLEQNLLDTQLRIKGGVATRTKKDRPQLHAKGGIAIGTRKGRVPTYI